MLPWRPVPVPPASWLVGRCFSTAILETVAEYADAAGLGRGRGGAINKYCGEPSERAQIRSIAQAVSCFHVFAKARACYAWGGGGRVTHSKGLTSGNH